MRTSRVFVRFAEGLLSGTEIELPDDTTHHLIRVLRLQQHDPVRVFNGEGEEWAGTLVQHSKKKSGVRIATALPPATRPLPVYMGIALIKGDALDRSVQKCVELGVASIDPLYSDYCSVRHDVSQESRRQTHLERIIIAACEQSGARYLPTLSRHTHVDELVRARDASSPHQFVVLDPTGDVFPDALPRHPTTLMVGPEGGWSAAELGRFHSLGVQVFRLGSQILRAETAPMVALAALRHGWRWAD